MGFIFTLPYLVSTHNAEQLNGVLVELCRVWSLVAWWRNQVTKKKMVYNLYDFDCTIQCRNENGKCIIMWNCPYHCPMENKVNGSRNGGFNYSNAIKWRQFKMADSVTVRNSRWALTIKSIKRNLRCGFWCGNFWQINWFLSRSADGGALFWNTATLNVSKFMGVWCWIILLVSNWEFNWRKTSSQTFNWNGRAGVVCTRFGDGCMKGGLKSFSMVLQNNEIVFV